MGYLRPIGGEEINAVSARELYPQSGLDGSNWSRWSKLNIEENQFAAEHEDWEGFNTMLSGREPNGDGVYVTMTRGGRPSKDYFLAFPFAKKLSMQVIAC